MVGQQNCLTVQFYLFADYLANDKFDDRDRGYAEFKHQHRLSDQWSLNTRLNHVTDRRYFEDFGNNVYSTSRSFLYSFFDVNGYGDSWRFKGQFNDYQVISDLISLQRQPYQKLPGLNYSWFGHRENTSNRHGAPEFCSCRLQKLFQMTTHSPARR